MYLLAVIILTICDGVLQHELIYQPITFQGVYPIPTFDVHTGFVIPSPIPVKRHNPPYNYQYGYNFGNNGNFGTHDIPYSYQSHNQGNHGNRGNNGNRKATKGNRGNHGNPHGNIGNQGYLYGNNGNPHGNNGNHHGNKHGNNGNHHGSSGNHHGNHGNNGYYGHEGFGNYGGYGSHGHTHKPGCGHEGYYPEGFNYNFETTTDLDSSEETTIKPVVNPKKPIVTTLAPSVSTSIPKETTTPEITTTEEPTSDPFAIDIRFGDKNKTVTKRATKEADQPTKASYTDNSLYPLGFWSFPNFYSGSPNRLATCVHKKYECVPIYKCKFANVSTNQRHCKFSDNVPYVCCEKQQTNKLAKRQDAICGKKKSSGKSSAIIGGANVANGNSYPWMVAIGQIDINGHVEWFCGGALVGSQTVVTAAHCLRRRSPDLVRIGELDLSKSESSTMQEIFVWRKFVHPSYRPPTMYADIALVYLDEPVLFNQFVKPVCLPQRAIGTPVGLLTGWGQLSFDGEKSNILQEVIVQVFNNSLCDKYYSVGIAAKRNFPRGILDTQMCAGDEQGGKDACQGDSGSPLVIDEDGSYVLTGIVSAGIGCGSKSFPGIYTRVSSFVPWILENLV